MAAKKGLKLMLSVALVMTSWGFFSASQAEAAGVHPSLPDWSHAGYKGGAPLPTGGTVIDLAAKGVKANDGKDVSDALQAVIDAIRSGSLTVNGAKVSETNRAILQFPAGEINLSKFIRADASWVTFRGAGTDPATGTKIVFRPASTYTSDNGLPVIDGKLWPGYGAFRVEDRDKDPGEPDYEGSINFHWKSGVKVANAGGGTKGGNQIKLASGGGKKFKTGDTVYVGAANTADFYQMMGAPQNYWINQHMRSQMFKVTSLSGDTLTIDKPLEFDIPYSNGGAILGTTYYSKVMPIKLVEGVGFENFYFTQDISYTPYSNKNVNDYDPVTNPNGVGLKYTNEAPEYAIHAIVFKWAQNGWVKGIRTYMTGSHPIVTEFARYMEFRDNVIFGSWNKGKGGHGYFRGSKLYDSKIMNNTIDRVRHLTLQWSATGNVVSGNTMTVDMNLHGGWERRNLIENNVITVPFRHRSWGEGEGGAEPEGGTWYPIWYGAGPHASKWSGSTGEQNVFFNNTMSKQETDGGSYTTYAPYNDPHRIYQIGWDGSKWTHLEKPAGTLISTWTDNEKVDYALAPNKGVYDCLTFSGTSLLGGGTAVLNCKGSSSGDTQAPSAPVNLTATGVTSSSVSFSWNASTDNVGVTGYDVFNGTALVATVTGTDATVSGLSPNTTYTFTVKAKDAAGNVSAASNAVKVTTSGGTQNPVPVTLTAAEDSFVRGGTYANDNYGSSDTMSVKLRASNASYDREGYVKFNLSSISGNISSATLKLYVTNIHSNTTSYRLEARGLQNDAWSETTINAANQPTEAGTLIGTATVNQKDAYVSFDATAFVKSQTDGAVSFRLVGLDEDLGADYATKEHANAAIRPVLVVNAGGSGGDTQPPSVPAGLSVTGKTSSSVSLAWNASTDNTGVTAYEVYNGSALVATVTGTTATVGGLSPNTMYTFTVKAKDAAGNASGASHPVSATTDAVGAGCSGALNSTPAIQNAIKNAKPGDIISIAPGTYLGDVSTSGDTPRTPDDSYGPGLFFSPKNGTAAGHIVLKSCDPANRAILTGKAVNDGSYGIHLTGDYWEIRDLIVTNAQKGIVVDNGNNNLLNNVEVHRIGDEGVHFRDGSSYNTLEYSKIYDTGNYQPGYGEGAYVGSDESSPYEHIVIGNTIRHTVFDGGITAEHIDIKEGADGTVVEYCYFNGTGMTGDNSADSFIDVKGVNSVIRYNEGYRNGNAKVADAFQVRTHGSKYPTGKDNTFYNNKVNLDNAPGYVVNATSAATGTKAHDDVRIGGGNLYNKNVNK